MALRPAAAVGGVLAAAVVVGPPPLRAQTLDITGYTLGVTARAGDSPLLPGGNTWLGRVRLMPALELGAVTLDAAYEHVLTRTPPGGGFRVTAPGGTSTDWLPLDWTVDESSRGSWRHHFDRLALSFATRSFEVTLGRQAISWATTLFLTPADPFSPFDPSDPFREYRGGVDALRVRAFPGPFSELEVVLRASDTPFGTTTTALARGQTSLASGSWSVGAWGGVLHDEAAGAAFFTGSVGATALRGEAELRQGGSGGATFRATLGADRFFRPWGRDLYVVAEVQHDGYGAPSSSNLLDIYNTKPFLRGELQVSGENSGAMRISYQWHPLVSVDVLALANLDDGSVLVAPGVSWSVTSSAAFRLGAFFGVGSARLDPVAGPASEYGLVPSIAYGSVSWFF